MPCNCARDAVKIDICIFNFLGNITKLIPIFLGKERNTHAMIVAYVVGIHKNIKKKAS